MKIWKRVAVVLASVSLVGAGFGLYAYAGKTAPKKAKVGEAAPDFTLTDTHGKKHKLSDFKKKYVVLEWLNHGCPFVKKHYNSGNMQKLQKKWTKKGVIWLSIASSAPGKQGYFTAKQANALSKKKKAAPTALLQDASGTVGRLYGARTTPHMFVISPKGVLLYAGAIDNNRSWDPSTIKGATNFVSQALTEAMAGKAVSKPLTRPYGCSVKYK
ncbi:MAG: thioredoxin family protein [Deltaproteobacteria bacterium]|nr:thioredoxin family protein [Deltaproteobacteria bacterium]|tara:strand:- start:19494 stop:20135 length:642 start_codon:yes stop_codon:yes gene_type:complete